MSEFMKVIEESNRIRLKQEIAYQARSLARKKELQLWAQAADEALDGRKQRYKSQQMA